MTPPKTHHVYSHYVPKDRDTRRRYEFAKASWAFDYEWPIGIGYDRVFKDGKRELPYIKDLIERGVAEAAPDDVVVLTNADTVISPAFYRCFREGLISVACSFRRNYSGQLGGLLSEDEVNRIGEPNGGCDLFCLTPRWWKQHSMYYPDMLLGAESWDWLLREQMVRCQGWRKVVFGGETFRKPGTPVVHDRPALCYHEDHAAHWYKKSNYDSIPSQIHNRTAAYPYLKALGLNNAPLPPEGKRERVDMTRHLQICGKH